ncbi:MAG: hypothetical protein AAB502_11830 [Chloroflexota bacterium]
MTLVTKAFEGLAKASAKGRGVPDLRVVVLPHPLDSLPEKQIRQIVRQHSDVIIHNLMSVPRVRTPAAM